jgi:hypothetical protein
MTRLLFLLTLYSDVVRNALAKHKRGREMNKFLVLILLIIFLGLISCENTIDPLDEETGNFTIYGALNVREQPNYIRVRELNDRFTAEATQDIDARVTLFNEADGSTTVLEDKRVEHLDLYHHNFEYDEGIIPNNQYRVTVERSDGSSLSLAMITPVVSSRSIAPVNQKCNLPVTFEMDPLEGGTVVVYFGFPLVQGNEEVTKNTVWDWGPKYIFEPNGNEQPRKVTFTFSPFNEIREILPFEPINALCYRTLTKSNLYLRYQHYGPGFYEDITKDSLNIMNTNRFGSVYYDTLEVPIDTSQICGIECVED